MRSTQDQRLRITVAAEADREEIYRIRHEIYGAELGQHQTNPIGRLTDALDAHNLYIVAAYGHDIAGFVSITPPEAPSFSLDKYVARDRLPFVCDGRTYEVRLLTVRQPYRGLPLAPLLLYAAFRWIEDRGGDVVFGIGRSEIKQIYAKLGAKPTGIEMQSGAVTYELMAARVDEYRDRLGRYAGFFRRLESRVDWRLDVPYERPMRCVHGGAFFQAVGASFDRLDRRHAIVNADVLDAWYSPSPRVTEALQAHLEWMLRTSPPAGCEGMIAAIAEARGVPEAAILPAAGSSSLIYLALGAWLTPRSRALVLDPTYGEYEHALKYMVGCRVTRLPMHRAAGYRLDPERLLSELLAPPGYDLVVIVNPNSPTGTLVPRSEMASLVERVPRRTRIWLDETYVEYAGDHSMEREAARSKNVVVCKSMSKVYALSGLRVAYLCGPPGLIAALRRRSPPWSVSLPGQVAAVNALGDPDYYHRCYALTREYRGELARMLAAIPGVEVFPSEANFLLMQLAPDGPDAATVVESCSTGGVFVRDASTMGGCLGSHAVRTAVKDAPTNRRIAATLARAIGGGGPAGPTATP